ncbi:MAG: phosphoribosylformylglycinamidine synthase I [Verrucomicrobiales bacterium]
MLKTPIALLPRYPGTNADEETARALRVAGFDATIVPSAVLTREGIAGADLIVFSGGFSYGDYVMSGRIAQLITQQRLAGALEEFVARGGHLLGICNGFQILTKLGLLPKASLIENTSGRFQCRWVKLRVRNPANPFLRELPTDVDIEFPIAHCEGRLVAPAGEAARYAREALAALTYAGDNPNGSEEAIAGLQDASGRVFGLMPHPERFLYASQHYNRDWSQLHGEPEWGWGYYFFKGIYHTLSGEASLLAGSEA